MEELNFRGSNYITNHKKLLTSKYSSGRSIGFKTIFINHENLTHKIQVWNTCGQEKFGTVSNGMNNTIFITKK